jgi:isopentenyl phosphate kinase
LGRGGTLDNNLLGVEGIARIQFNDQPSGLGVKLAYPNFSNSTARGVASRHTADINARKVNDNTGGILDKLRSGTHALVRCKHKAIFCCVKPPKLKLSRLTRQGKE